MQIQRKEEKEMERQQQQQLLIGEKKVKDLIVEKRRLIEVPYTASLADTMNVLMSNRIVAVPVAAPPGHWIGAGGSMIVEADKKTGVVRKHYIGMVTMLDILAHIAGSGDDNDHKDKEEFDKRISVHVSSIIGHCLESLSLWTLNPNTSIIDCMEVFSKGIHRALVPVDSQIENVSAGVELSETASGYRMLTQMDVVKFLRNQSQSSHDHELNGIFSRSVKETGLTLTDVIFGITDKARVIDAIKCMRSASLVALPIVQSSSDAIEEEEEEEDHSQLINGKERKLVATFSSTDLRCCPISELESCLNMGVVEFLEKLATTPLHEASGLRSSVREPIVCHSDSLVGEVIDKAITYSVHRVWIVNGNDLLEGLVSLTDMIRVMRVWMLTGNHP